VEVEASETTEWSDRLPLPPAAAKAVGDAARVRRVRAVRLRAWRAAYGAAMVAVGCGEERRSGPRPSEKVSDIDDDSARSL